MSIITEGRSGQKVLLMGNEAIARGAIEGGVKVCAAYPGNPSSEIIGTLAKIGPELDIYVEWSANEKVALEVAAAASFAGIRGLAAMKQNGLNVASDFLFNLNLTGSIGGLVVVVCDDPGAISSTNEEDTRAYAKIGDLPLLEPSTVQEAKSMIPFAFELSEELGLPCLVRSVTRISHARGSVELDDPVPLSRRPHFNTGRPLVNVPALAFHRKLRAKLHRCRDIFETSEFNEYLGPEQPEALIVASGTPGAYAQETLNLLKAEDRVGIIKLGTTWPLPESFLVRQLRRADVILVAEDVDTFLETNLKALCAQKGRELGIKRFLGRGSGTLPDVGEITPDCLTTAVAEILKISYEARPPEYARTAQEAVSRYAPTRQVGFCAGCPHRAAYWCVKTALALDGRDGFLVGDIGCYSLGFGPSGFEQMKTLHSMGSGAGIAGGMGQLARFGFDQPVMTVCGDSTFYHAALPALFNAIYNQANFLMLILDNSATAMTGFQPHPGTGQNAMGRQAPVVDIEAVCRTLGARIEVADPYDLQGTIEAVNRLLVDEKGVKVLILRQLCALVRANRGEKLYQVRVDQERCLGDGCGCNRLCTRVFRCPGLIWDKEKGRAGIDDAICTGCGVCGEICPQSAILTEEI
ncbi:MAG: indolepyruvate ferredoxin oxidoreductase [Proteobacteria bacterium]|nr:indolepyruvate ferredoxin oxidoreductase [Pseudomonadota bacterium]NIS69106.1 indolepyruvate ferredoxin oxidoreductase [Pseudomonadota bacterium]